MSIAGIIKHVLDGLWLVGGIGAAADLSMEDFGPGAATPCPQKAVRPCRDRLTSCACPADAPRDPAQPQPR